MLHSFDDTTACHIRGKRITKELKFENLLGSERIPKFMCLSALSGRRKIRKRSVMSGSVNHIDPDLRSEREVVGRQLAHMGDNLLQSYGNENTSRKICFALSIAAAGLAGVALFLIAKDKD